MNNAYLFPGLEGSIPALELLIGKLSPAQLDTPTHQGRFSPREVIAHLADWEPILLDRIKTAKASPGSTIEAQDEGEMAIRNRYSELDVRAQLDAFKRARGETVVFLKTLASGDWDLHVIHPEQGRRTIDDMAAMLVGHDHYHLEQLSEVVAG